MRATNPGRDPSSRIALKYQCVCVCVCVDVQAHLRMHVCYDAGVFVDGMSLMCRTWLVSIIPSLCMHLFCSVGLQWTLWTGGQRSRIHPTSSV